jgi:hypothetical protein
LSSDFEGQFNQLFPCYVVRTPDTIKIEIYESGVRFRPILAELYLPVPEPTVTSDNYELQSFEFSAETLRRISPSQSTAVGAGVSIPWFSDDSNIKELFVNIEGTLRAAVAWGVQDGAVSVPPDYATSRASLRFVLTIELTSHVRCFQPSTCRPFTARHQYEGSESK